MMHYLFLAAAIVSAAVSSGSATRADLECGVVLPGTDLMPMMGNLPGAAGLNGPLDACIKVCQDMPGCNAVIRNVASGNCYLKTVPDDVEPTPDRGFEAYILCSSDEMACCAEGYMCCGFECIPSGLTEVGVPCLEIDGGCCPEPMDNCCEEGSICCDGRCLDTMTQQDVLNIDVCGDYSCCDVAFAPGPGPAFAPEFAPAPVMIATVVDPAPPPPLAAPAAVVSNTLDPDETPAPGEEVGFSNVFGGDDGVVDASDAQPAPTDPEILSDEDFINEGINNCCPVGYFCCGNEIGCLEDHYAPDVECSVVGPDSPIPCCAGDY